MYRLWIGLGALIGFIGGAALTLSYAVPRFIERTECDGFCYSNAGEVLAATIGIGLLAALGAGLLIHNQLRRKRDSPR